MQRSKERRPYHLARYRQVNMDHVLALLSDEREDYYVEFRRRRERKRS